MIGQTPVSFSERRVALRIESHAHPECTAGDETDMTIASWSNMYICVNVYFKIIMLYSNFLDTITYFGNLASQQFFIFSWLRFVLSL